MKALVTGATGFVGAHIVRALVEAGYSVRVLYRSESKLGPLADLDLETAAGTLADSAALEAACAGCDVVFHAAAKADYWKDDDRAALWQINVDGTRNLLAAAKASGAGRVIFTSSASTIGIRPGAEPADESVAFNLPRERFYYAWTKLQAEAVVAEFVADGMDIVTLNPAVIIGPGDLNAISGSFIIETARYQWLVPMSSGGISVIDVRDVARAHVKAIERGKSGQRYILSAANLTYHEWFRLIAAACECAPAALLNARPPAGADRSLGIDALRRLGMQTPMDANQTRLGSVHVTFDARKANRELGPPEIDIETSLRDTFNWYQQHGYIKPNLLTRLISLL